MRAEVKVGLVVALVVFAGGAIWWFSRGNDQQGSVPFNKSEVERSHGTTRLAQDAVPQAVTPKRPARSPALGGPKRPVGQPVKRTALTTPKPAVGEKPAAVGGRRPLAGVPKTGSARPAAGPTGTPATAGRGEIAGGASPAGRGAKPSAAVQPGAKTSAARKSGPTLGGSPPVARVGDRPASEVPKAKPSLGGTPVKSDSKPPTLAPPKRRDQSSPARPAFGATTRSYTIVAGDTLIDIAREEYGDEKLWPAIKAANPGLDERRLRIGMKIKLPGKAEAQRLVGAAAGGGATVGRPARPGEPGAARIYVVGEGDTLIGIARNVLGKASRWHEIYELNKDQLDSPDVIRPGMKLKLPEK